MTQKPDRIATGHIKIIAKGRCADGRYYLKLRIRSEGKSGLFNALYCVSLKQRGLTV
jgi:hypothetical protein